MMMFQDAEKDTLHWMLDTTGFELLFGLKNETHNTWLFRYETPLSSQRSHSALLVPLFKEACTVANLPLAQVEQLTVCIGPGSFTGLRAGLATVKTLGQWLPKLKITPVTIFERLRLQGVLAGLIAKNCPLTVMLDAKQNRLYTATFHPKTGWEAPQFMMLDAWFANITTAQQTIIANETLIPVMKNHQSAFIPIENLNSFALEALALVEPSPVAWQALEPLYLQSPNITIKKTIIKEVC
jgi:tRNA threonylcarbamoyl adenosine modification protein YeaZ